MHGLMMNWPLMISSLIRHADRCHGDTEIVSRTIEGPIHRYTYRDAHARARRLASALARLGVAAGRPRRHARLERLPPLRALLRRVRHGRGHPHDQPAALPRPAHLHRQPRRGPDRLLRPHVPAAGREARARVPGREDWIALTDRAHMPQSAFPSLLCYEDLLAAESDDFDWPEFDENTAAASATPRARPAIRRACSTATARRCCTPMAVSLPDAKGYSAHERRCCRSCRCSTSTPGACRTRRRWSARSWCFPAPGSTARACTSCSRAKASTASAGVPTVWLGLINYMKQNKLKFSTLKSTTIGGSACPPAMIRTLRDEFGVRVLHGWGMTEMSPVGTINSPKAQAPRAVRRRAQFALLAEAGPAAVRRRDEDRRRRRQRAAARRQGRRRRAGARAVGRARLLQGRGRRVR